MGEQARTTWEEPGRAGTADRIHRRDAGATRRGFTMVELMIVMAIIIVMAALAIPSLTGLTRSSSDGAARTALRSLFSSARARAATYMQYVGVRFQQDRDGRMWAIMLQQPKPSNDFPNGCPAYEPNCTYLTFVAANDVDPIPLPKGVELARGDLASTNPPPTPIADNQFWWTPTLVSTTAPRPNNAGNVPATTFTVVFSPSGQIVRRDVHVAQRPDTWKNDGSGDLATWDSVFSFNSTAGQSGGKGMFRSDAVNSGNAWPDPATAKRTTPILRPPPPMGTGTDRAACFPSQTSILVYEHQQRVNNATSPFTGYVQVQGTLVPLNVYTGAPVKTQR